jgi:hypothetical protein
VPDIASFAFPAVTEEGVVVPIPMLPSLAMKSDDVASLKFALDPRNTYPFVSPAWSVPETYRLVVVAFVNVPLVASKLVIFEVEA